MTDSVDVSNKLSNELKEYLTTRLTKSEHQIKKLKRKRKVYKLLFIITTSASIIICVILASVSSLTIPPTVVPILSIASGVLTGLGAKLRFEDKKDKIKK